MLNPPSTQGATFAGRFAVDETDPSSAVEETVSLYGLMLVKEASAELAYSPL
jgi:hypothetical protein